MIEALNKHFQGVGVFREICLDIITAGVDLYGQLGQFSQHSKRGLSE